MRHTPAAVVAAMLVVPGVCRAQEAAPDWRAAEAPLLTEHVQVTSRERFVKAGEAYFDHQSPPRWIVFQAVPNPGEGREADAFYSMYVARLRYEGSGERARIVGIEEPVRISPEGSANTCGWFHPAEPHRVLFGSTLVKPKAPEGGAGSGYRGGRGYVWQFPDEMDVVERAVPQIVPTLPESDPVRRQMARLEAIKADFEARLAKIRPRMTDPALKRDQQQAAAQEYVSVSDEMLARLDEDCPDVRSRQDWMAPRPVFTRGRYDAECSWSPDGRFVLYAHVRDERTAAPDGPPKDDADIWVYDTKDDAHFPLVAHDGYDGGPFFSPDGKRICYRSDRRMDDKLQIYVADLRFGPDGVTPVGVEREQAVTAGEDVNWAPYWHPTGRYLVFASSRVSHGNYEVFAAEVPPMGETVDVARIRTRRVTQAAGADILPAFSDDGRWMVWTAQRGEPAKGEPKASSQVWIARTGAAMKDAKAMFADAPAPRP